MFAQSVGLQELEPALVTSRGSGGMSAEVELGGSRHDYTAQCCEEFDHNRSSLSTTTKTWWSPRSIAKQ